MDPAAGAAFELTVDGVAHGGGCVGRAPDGRVVFVRHALPGERVRVQITAQRSRYLRGDAVEVLDRSPDRVVPPCPYAGAGRCGGCDWQHVSLPAQRWLKATVVREQLFRLAGLDVDVEVAELPGAPGGLAWRTRMQFAVRGDGVPGLRRHRSHEVEPVEACLIAHPLVESLGVERRSWPGIRSVEVAVGAATGDTTVRTHPRGGGAVGEGGSVREVAAGRSWRVSVGGFWQVHPAAADVLVETVLGMLQPGRGERAVDLYCGAGLFAGALAERVGAGGSVLAVESDRLAAADATANLRDLPQVVVRTGRVDGALLRRLLDPAGTRPDLIVLDPPRAGAGAEVVAALTALVPRAVCYVACDPAALARDVATFAGHGYRLSRLRAFDLFPMTAHVECVALLERA